jgi:hypothetical protein
MISKSRVVPDKFVQSWFYKHLLPIRGLLREAFITSAFFHLISRPTNSNSAFLPFRLLAKGRLNQSEFLETARPASYRSRKAARIMWAKPYHAASKFEGIFKGLLTRLIFSTFFSSSRQSVLPHFLEKRRGLHPPPLDAMSFAELRVQPTRFPQGALPPET